MGLITPVYYLPARSRLLMNPCKSFEDEKGSWALMTVRVTLLSLGATGCTQKPLFPSFCINNMKNPREDKGW